jgi:hypothetical protein
MHVPSDGLGKSELGKVFEKVRRNFERKLYDPQAEWSESGREQKARILASANSEAFEGRANNLIKRWYICDSWRHTFAAALLAGHDTIAGAN